MIVGNSDRETNESTMKWGTLSQMTYPTGGSTNFDYEANTYYGSRTVSTATTMGSVSRYWPGGQCFVDGSTPASGASQTLTFSDFSNIYYNWQVKYTDAPCTCSPAPYATLEVYSGTTLITSLNGNASCPTSTTNPIQEMGGKLIDLIPSLAAYTDTP